MTFDFAPDWMTSLIGGSPQTQQGLPHLPLMDGLRSPNYPSNAETAALVSELFTEGTLSPEQMCSLVGLPELRPHLRDVLAAQPAPRTK
jgi:hypothetical protein